MICTGENIPSSLYYFLRWPLYCFCAAEKFTPPASPLVIYSFNLGLKFIPEDVTNAEQVVFDGSK
jgi:hypothetical protein